MTLSTVSCLDVNRGRELFTAMTDQGEPVDAEYLDFSEAFDSVCNLLIAKKTVAMGIHLKITCWVEEFLKNRTFQVKLGGHLSSEVSLPNHSRY